MHHPYGSVPGSPAWTVHQSLGHLPWPSPTQATLSRRAADRYAQLEQLDDSREPPRRTPGRLARLRSRLAAARAG